MLRSPLRAYFVSGFILSRSQQTDGAWAAVRARIDRRRLLRLSRIQFKREPDREATASPIRRIGPSLGWLAGSLAEDSWLQEMVNVGRSTTNRLPDQLGPGPMAVPSAPVPSPLSG